MTIEVYGHVLGLDYRGSLVLVRIQIEASRMDAGNLGKAPEIAILAKPDEVESYRPGMGIHIQVRPLVRA